MALSVLATARGAAFPCRKLPVGLTSAGSSKHAVRLARSKPSLPQPSGPAVPNGTASRNVSCNVAIGMGSMSAATGMFTACTAYTATLYSMMLVAPVTKTFQKLLQSNVIFVPIGLAYLYLLIQSWSPDSLSLLFPGDLTTALQSGGQPQFFPKLAGIMTLFSRPATVPSIWAHLLAINLFTARFCYLDGMDRRVPTLHSVLLTAVFGPLGYLSHQFTKANASKRITQLAAASETAPAATQNPREAAAPLSPPAEDAPAPPASASADKNSKPKRGRKGGKSKATAVPSVAGQPPKPEAAQPTPPPPSADDEQPSVTSHTSKDIPAELPAEEAVQAPAAATAPPPAVEEEANLPTPAVEEAPAAAVSAAADASAEEPSHDPAAAKAVAPAAVAAIEEAPAAVEAAEEAPAAATVDEAPAAATVEEAPAAATAEAPMVVEAVEAAPAAAAAVAATEDVPAATAAVAATEEVPAAAAAAATAGKKVSPAPAAEEQVLMGGAPKVGAVVLETEQGTITLLPY